MDRGVALVLRRNPGQTIVVTTPDGHRIVVEASYDAAKGAVRVAIDAPDDVRIVRGELDERPTA
jgi:sRNA-binding carbon storage regulator CsrA